MITRIQKWGNSQGIRISKELLAQMNIEVGESVELSAEGSALVITPVRRVRGSIDLAELIARMPRDAAPEELDWGAPSGAEVW